MEGTAAESMRKSQGNGMHPYPSRDGCDLPFFLQSGS